MKKGPAYKWRLAMGTTSRVPNSRLHYLIADFDDVTWLGRGVGHIAMFKPDHIFVQKTPRGWHIYTDLQYTFKKLIEVLGVIGADRKWLEIGKERGYLFLADKGPVTVPWPVERMRLNAPKS